MKINIICLLFGHRLSEDQFFENNNIQFCSRCKDERCSVHIQESRYWTNLQSYGLLIYPLKLIQWMLQGFYYWVKNKLKRDNFDRNSDIPF